MSEQGICSRREADSYIERGWVLVDGVPVTELGTRIFPNQKITLARQAQSRQEASVTILLHKPIGYVSAQAEKGYQPAITLIAAGSRFGGDRSPLRFSPAHLRGLAPAGRLDIDSTGLLVLTHDRNQNLSWETQEVGTEAAAHHRWMLVQIHNQAQKARVRNQSGTHLRNLGSQGCLNCRQSVSGIKLNLIVLKFISI